LTQYEVFFRSTAVQREPIVEFHWKHFYIVDSYMQTNNTKGRYCCLFRGITFLVQHLPYFSSQGCINWTK